MIAICDCNSFYTASHVMFRPDLWDKPVCVLSNNRGVVVSLNSKAKKLGIKRGMNEFENKEFFRKNGVVLFESNYELYDNLSDRVMITLAEFVEKSEVYSIDEAFLLLKGYQNFGYEKYGRQIAGTVKQYTGITVSLGIAKTKTLAKIANRFSKKYPRFNNVFVMDSEQKRIECLKRTTIGDVWGIGSQLEERLNIYGIFTAWDFVTKISQQQARRIYSIELERTWCELNGICCYPVVDEPLHKKSIAATRSFPGMIQDKESIRQAIATYAAICASDLRKQNTFAVKIRVFLKTNRFRENLPQYNPFREITLPLPSNSSATLVKYCLKAVDEMFLPGFKYKKGGVEVIQITENIQTTIYSPVDRELRNSKISRVEDFYAHGFDRKLCSFAVMGFGDRKNIDLRQEEPHVCYTTNFNHIMEIDCTE